MSGDVLVDGEGVKITSHIVGNTHRPKGLNRHICMYMYGSSKIFKNDGSRKES